MNKKDKAGTKDTADSKKIESINNKNAEARKMKEEIGDMESFEDNTKYGEFMASYFSWMTLENQKKDAKRLENITKKLDS